MEAAIRPTGTPPRGPTVPLRKRFRSPRAAPWVAALVLALSVAPPARADLFALLAENASSKRLVRIDPATGAATTLYGSYAIGPFSTGAGLLNASNGNLYLCANAPGEERRRLFVISLATGALVSSPLIGAPAGAPATDLVTTTPAFLVSQGTTVYGLFTLNATEKCLGSIDPTTGAVTQLGAAIPAGGFAGGVGAYSTAVGVVYFTAEAVPGGGRVLFGFGLATNTLVSAAAVVPPSGCVADPAHLEVDGSGILLGVFRSPSAGTMVLAEVDPATGATTSRGAGFSAGGSSSGVGDYAWGARMIHIAANGPGEALRRIYTLDTATGALVSDPVITSADGYQTAPLFLAAQPVASTVPGAVPDGEFVRGTALKITKNGPVPTTLTLTWGRSCGPGAADYSVHVGTVGTWYSHRRALCTTANATSASVSVPTGNHYYLIVPLSGTQEGSYGCDSQGHERPVSTVTCLATQNTAACP